MRSDSPEETIAQMKKDLIGLKSSQSSGYDNTKAYLVERNTTWDWERTASFSSPQSEEHHDIYMKFIADNQVAPTAQMVITCLIDNSVYFKSNVGDTSGNGMQNGVFFNGTFQDVYGGYSPDKPIANQPNEVSWYDHIALAPSGKNVKLKFRVYATDTGTLRIKIGNTYI